MTKYGNKTGESGIQSYELFDDAIVVRFLSGGVYLYDHASPGPEKVREMKRLALEGKGLNGYINRQVRKAYAKRLA